MIGNPLTGEFQGYDSPSTQAGMGMAAMSATGVDSPLAFRMLEDMPGIATAAGFSSLRGTNTLMRGGWGRSRKGVNRFFSTSRNSYDFFGKRGSRLAADKTPFLRPSMRNNNFLNPKNWFRFSDETVFADPKLHKYTPFGASGFFGNKTGGKIASKLGVVDDSMNPGMSTFGPGTISAIGTIGRINRLENKALGGNKRALRKLGRVDETISRLTSMNNQVPGFMSNGPSPFSGRPAGLRVPAPFAPPTPLSGVPVGPRMAPPFPRPFSPPTGFAAPTGFPAPRGFAAPKGLPVSRTFGPPKGPRMPAPFPQPFSPPTGLPAPTALPGPAGFAPPNGPPVTAGLSDDVFKRMVTEGADGLVAGQRGLRAGMMISAMPGKVTQNIGGRALGAMGYATDASFSANVLAGMNSSIGSIAEALTPELSLAGKSGAKYIGETGAKALLEKGVFKEVGLKGIGEIIKVGGPKAAGTLGLRAAGLALPGLQVVAAASFIYDIGQMAGEVVKSGIELARDAGRSLQGTIAKPTFGMGYKDTEAAATSRARGVMAIQNSRLNMRSLLGSEASMMAAHYG